jgi:hypothetical protein
MVVHFCYGNVFFFSTCCPNVYVINMSLDILIMIWIYTNNFIINIYVK